MEARALLKIVNKTCCRGEWPSTCPSHSATSSNLLIASISLDFYPYTGNNSFKGLDWLTRKTFLRILVKFGNWISQNLNQMFSLWEMVNISGPMNWFITKSTRAAIHLYTTFEHPYALLSQYITHILLCCFTTVHSDHGGPRENCKDCIELRCSAFGALGNPASLQCFFDRRIFISCTTFKGCQTGKLFRNRNVLTIQPTMSISDA